MTTLAEDSALTPKVQRPPTKLGMSMLEFFEWDATLGIKNLSPAQRITLKVIQGEPLDEVTPIPISHPFQERAFVSEVEMFKTFSGKDHYGLRSTRMCRWLGAVFLASLRPSVQVSLFTLQHNSTTHLIWELRLTLPSLSFRRRKSKRVKSTQR